MNLAQAVSLVGATVGFCFALLSLGLARAPGWRDLRWFGLIAASAGAFCTSQVFESPALPDGTLAVLERLVPALGALHVCAWLRYGAAQRGRGLRGFERPLVGALLVVAALCPVPGVVFSDELSRHGAAWVGGTYIDARQTPLGSLALGVILAAGMVPFVRYVSLWRAGARWAGAHALATAGLLVTSLSDAVDNAWTRNLPHLFPVGLLWAVGAVGVGLLVRFVEGASALEALSWRLEQAVEARTAELSRAQQDLTRAERFAMLGRLSGAVAHEINNPAAVVAANLDYLRDALRGGDGAPGDAIESLTDALESVGRITRVVQQLADASRSSGTSPGGAPVGVAELARAAVADAQASLGPDVEVQIDVPLGLYARSQAASLRQVLASLVTGAGEAMRHGLMPGKIVIRAERRDDRVLVRVVDPCPEADDIVRQRRFDPYVSQRLATGDMGLGVSVVLVRILGGRLEVEQSGATGSVVCVDLGAAEAPAASSEPPGSVRAARARVLLVEADVLVRIGLRRLVGREYVLDEAGSVAEALEHLREHPDAFDAIVCDLALPEPGVARFLEDLRRLAPALADAVVFLGLSSPGGPPAVEGRTVSKPIDGMALRVQIERARARGRRSLPRAAPRAGATS